MGDVPVPDNATLNALKPQHFCCNAGLPLLFSLLPHENKMTVLHFNLTRVDDDANVNIESNGDVDGIEMSNTDEDELFPDESVTPKLSMREDNVSLIVENCKACHNLNIRINEIPFLYDISKDEFVKLMLGYKTQKTNNVMHRISKVLSKDDILDMADLIYD